MSAWAAKPVRCWSLTGHTPQSDSTAMPGLWMDFSICNPRCPSGTVPTMSMPGSLWQLDFNPLLLARFIQYVSHRAQYIGLTRFIIHIELFQHSECPINLPLSFELLEQYSRLSDVFRTTGEPEDLRGAMGALRIF
jgi:hypothetical protein